MSYVDGVPEDALGRRYSQPGLAFAPDRGWTFASSSLPELYQTAGEHEEDTPHDQGETLHRILDILGTDGHDGV